MKPVRIFRHVSCEPPSYLCTYLTQCNVPFEVICLDEGLPVPDNLDDISGLIFMGGAGSVNDPKKWITQEIMLIQQAELKNIPVLGICFGAQLLSKALGGVVSPGQEMEIGWHNVESVDEAGKTQSINTDMNQITTEKPWQFDLPKQFEVFQWHAHTFSLPTDATSLWKSKCYQQQGFSKGRMLAMQFHLEVTVDSVRTLAKRYASDLSQPSACAQSLEQINNNLVTRVEQLHRVADVIYHRWLTLAELIEK